MGKALEGKLAEVIWCVQHGGEETEGRAYCGLQHAQEGKQKAGEISDKIHLRPVTGLKEIV